MLLCADVDYRDPGALAAGVVFARWPDEAELRSVVAPLSHVEPYEPGSFYKRELPCLLALLALITEPLDTIIIDGYVWLDAAGRKGLGAHLFDALDRKINVVGVAKTSFAGASAAPVLRGGSKHPLWVTAAGIDTTEAAAHVASMHGAFRLPTLLKKVDRLCRDAAL